MSIAQNQSPPPVSPTDHDLDAFLRLVDERIADVFAQQRSIWCADHASVRPGIDVLERFVLSGGKRIRPTLSMYSFREAGGATRDGALVDLAASMELLHAFALIHDDVMDDSGMRRHQPSIHHHYATVHGAAGWRGEQRRTSESMAVLLGDLAFALSVQLQTRFDAAVRAMLDDVRIELHIGQYLDLMAASTGERSTETIDAITRYKTARYTIERPLQLGAALAGDTRHTDTYERYGIAVGEAFQHRDDILGVFGAPSDTGKPIHDDLHAGKATLLVQYAFDADPEFRFAPLHRLGTDDFTDRDAESIAGFMVECGALQRAEDRISSLVDDAHRALASSTLEPETRHALETTAHRVAWRAA